MRDRLALRVWTPLPPQRSGVADHNMLLLPALADVADISVVVNDDSAVEVRVPQGVDTVRRSQVRHQPADLSIYHMGNHHGLHRDIHDELIANPGLTVLHDPSLVDFYRAYHEASPGGFDAEVTLNLGPLQQPLPEVRAGGDWHLDRLALHLVRRVIDASLAVVVHSAWARDMLARQFPEKSIHQLELAAPVVAEGTSGSEVRDRLGWGPEQVVFGMLGGLWQHKRPELVARIFAALHVLRPQARFLVAGRMEDRDAVVRMLAEISGAELKSAVQIITDVDDHEFAACISACDAVVDLRWPSAGETSSTMMAAFGAGRPVIVSDLPQLAALDERFCWRIPTQPPQAARAALDVMLAVARDPSNAREAGRLARRFVADTATPERVARRYEEIARQAIAASGRVSTRRSRPSTGAPW